MPESYSDSDTQSVDSTPNEVKEFNPIDDIEAQGNMETLSHHLSRILSTPEGMEKVASLARALSTKTKEDLDHFEINPQDFDLQLLLKYLHERSYQQGIESAHSGLAFKDLTCWGIDASAAYGPSVPEMMRDFFKWPTKLFQKDTRSQRQIIRNFMGIIKPGELVLALGKPGAGCSSLLKACAGEIENFTKVEGDFSYDGLNQQEMMDKYKGMYCFINCFFILFDYDILLTFLLYYYRLRCLQPRIGFPFPLHYCQGDCSICFENKDSKNKS